MNEDSFIDKHFLLLLQLGGWAGYIISDHIGHLMYGSNHPVASSLSGLNAMLLTGALAFFNNHWQTKKTILKGVLFLFCLFVIAVFWKNSFNLFHQHTDFEELLSYSVQQWLSGSSNAFFYLLHGQDYFLLVNIS